MQQRWTAGSASTSTSATITAAKAACECCSKVSCMVLWQCFVFRRGRGRLPADQHVITDHLLLPRPPLYVTLATCRRPASCLPPGSTSPPPLPLWSLKQTSGSSSSSVSRSVWCAAFAEMQLLLSVAVTTVACRGVRRIETEFCWWCPPSVTHF